MDRFGYRRIPEDLNGHNIHRLENVLTLESSAHEAFDRLGLWFESTVGIPFGIPFSWPDVCRIPRIPIRSVP